MGVVIISKASFAQTLGIILAASCASASAAPDRGVAAVCSKPPPLPPQFGHILFHQRGSRPARRPVRRRGRGVLLRRFAEQAQQAALARSLCSNGLVLAVGHRPGDHDPLVVPQPPASRRAGVRQAHACLADAALRMMVATTAVSGDVLQEQTVLAESSTGTAAPVPGPGRPRSNNGWAAPPLGEDLGSGGRDHFRKVYPSPRRRTLPPRRLRASACRSSPRWRRTSARGLQPGHVGRLLARRAMVTASASWLCAIPYRPCRGPPGPGPPGLEREVDTGVVAAEGQPFCAVAPWLHSPPGPGRCDPGRRHGRRGSGCCRPV